MGVSSLPLCRVFRVPQGFGNSVPEGVAHRIGRSSPRQEVAWDSGVPKAAGAEEKRGIGGGLFFRWFLWPDKETDLKRGDGVPAISRSQHAHRARLYVKHTHVALNYFTPDFISTAR